MHEATQDVVSDDSRASGIVKIIHYHETDVAYTASKGRVGEAYVLQGCGHVSSSHGGNAHALSHVGYQKGISWDISPCHESTGVGNAREA